MARVANSLGRANYRDRQAPSISASHFTGHSPAAKPTRSADTCVPDKMTSCYLPRRGCKRTLSSTGGSCRRDSVYILNDPQNVRFAMIVVQACSTRDFDWRKRRGQARSDHGQRPVRPTNYLRM
ncbi:unnamed protein product [Schistocephalus solidus]|uniref:Transposase n=1 Tax=Schistocephalus solidus TaxID=70667 RepID=A0A183T3D8_SCHSO|nr:unnamed protein product [Schistocephalus solidus]